MNAKGLISACALYVLSATPFCLQAQTAGIEIPVQGNSWWKDAKETAMVRTYFRVSRTGSAIIYLKPAPGTAGRWRISLNGKANTVKLQAVDTGWIKAGKWTIPDTGYQQISLLALDGQKGGKQLPVKAYRVEGAALAGENNYVKNNEGNFFYWGRRGPSTHLNYPIPAGVQAEWFYNEVTVPVGEDKIGSYFMANGFGEGYFGMQVNSPTERRILFSVWSPFHTDDPRQIPDSQKIILFAKGAAVRTGEFGNEGSGGQSYLVFPWTAGATYRFLLHAVPDGKGKTDYSAFFYDPATAAWRLIASFKRPGISTFITRPHSFLENFDPETGEQSRKVYFGNQWICDPQGNWAPLTHAGFSADNTARVGYRKDYGGGVEEDRFFLRNDGFFADFTPIGSRFERSGKSSRPELDLNAIGRLAKP